MPTPSRRRRGAQPSNRNALKHGIYSSHHPAAYHSLSPLKRILSPSLFADPDLLLDTLHEMQSDMPHFLDLARDSQDMHKSLLWSDRLVSGVGHIIRLKALTCWFLLRSDHLRHIASHALDLILLDFQRSGITRDADSFREKSKLSDFNSPPAEEPPAPNLSSLPDPFLDPQQWSLLDPLLPPSERTGQRGRPPADPHPLLDAIFWKLAHHVRWQDLPAHYPPMLTCRRYYRRLFLSGRLATLYRLLYQDLLARGGVELPAWVEQDRFVLLDKQVILRPGIPGSWQARTALLFMQQAWQVFRSLAPHVPCRSENTVEYLLNPESLCGLSSKGTKHFDNSSAIHPV